MKVMHMEATLLSIRRGMGEQGSYWFNTRNIILPMTLYATQQQDNIYKVQCNSV